MIRLLSREIPVSIGQLRQLESLISHNDLSDKIPFCMLAIHIAIKLSWENTSRSRMEYAGRKLELTSRADTGTRNLQPPAISQWLRGCARSHGRSAAPSGRRGRTAAPLLLRRPVLFSGQADSGTSLEAARLLSDGLWGFGVER
ncbi:hypothetical protein BS78_03G237900 [Paspalum vaginatum]|nr:hypothetical protein BS78_03G237900 [Paspalum vaginatum]